MIVLVSAVFPPEPVVAAWLSYDLAVALSEKYDVTVLSPKPSRPCGFSFSNDLIHHPNFDHVVLDSYVCPRSKLLGRLIESYSFGRHAVDYLSKIRHRIECLYISAWPLLAPYLLVRVSNKYKIPSIIHVQDIYPESLSNRIPFFRKLITKILLPVDIYTLNHASQIIAISENMQNTLEITRKIPAFKIKVVRNWQDESKFHFNIHVKHSITQGNTKPFTFMYLGNIGPVACIDFIIKSFIQANLNGAKLVIAGSGSQKKKCMRISELHKHVNIVFMDVPSGKVTEIQNSADVFLLSTRKGTSLSSVPSKLPAYMFSKKPIIACVDNESDVAIAIKESNCGWIVSPEETDSLIQVMKEAISRPGRDLMQYGGNGYNYALKNYSKSINLNLLVSVIIQTMNS